MEEKENTGQEMQNEINGIPEHNYYDKSSWFLSIIRNKRFIISATIIAYTFLVIVITVKVDRSIIANQIQKSFSEAFSVQTDNQQDNKLNEKESLPATKPKETTNNINIRMGETVTKEDTYELTVVGFDFTKKVVPPSTSSFYTYYEAKEDGHQYLDIKLNYKNLVGSGISANDVGSVKIKYADKYEYTSFSIIEDGGDFTYSNITNIDPLTVGRLHYLIDIPDEVANSDSSIVAYINVKGATYEFKIR